MSAPSSSKTDALNLSLFSSGRVPSAVREVAAITNKPSALERVLRQLLDRAHVALVVYDASGDCLYTTGAMASMMGADMSTWQRTSLWEVGPWQTSGLVRDAMLTLTDGEERRRFFDTPHQDRRSQATVCRLQYGESDCIAVMAVPFSCSLHPPGTVTNDDLASFAAATAHRVNNGLVPASCALDMLAEQHADSKVTTMLLAQAQQAIERVAQGVSSAVEVMATGPTPASQQISFTQFFASLSNSLAADDASRLELPRTLEELPTVRGSASRVEEALRHLIDNALEACEGTVRVEAREETSFSSLALCSGDTLPPGRYVVIDVIDDGPGVPPSARARASLPFFSTKGLGRGLGLTSATQVAREHGGGINLHTQPDGTHRVSLWLHADIAHP